MCVYMCKLLFVFGKPPLKPEVWFICYQSGRPFRCDRKFSDCYLTPSVLLLQRTGQEGGHTTIWKRWMTLGRMHWYSNRHQESGPRWTPDGPYRRSKGWMVTKTQEICCHMFFTSQWPSGSRVRCLNWMVSSPNKCQNQKSVLPWPS